MKSFNLNNNHQINVRKYRRGNKDGQLSETISKWYRRRRRTNQKHNTKCVGHHYEQANTDNVNKKKNGDKDEESIVLSGLRNGYHMTVIKGYIIGQHNTTKEMSNTDRAKTNRGELRYTEE